MSKATRVAIDSMGSVESSQILAAVTPLSQILGFGRLVGFTTATPHLREACHYIKRRALALALADTKYHLRHRSHARRLKSQTSL